VRRLTPLEALEVVAMSLWQLIQGVLPLEDGKQRAASVLADLSTMPCSG
jgi:hypothetical protein